MTKERVLKALEELGRQNDTMPMHERLEALRTHVNAMPQEDYEAMVNKGPTFEMWINMGIAVVRIFGLFKEFLKMFESIRPILR